MRLALVAVLLLCACPRRATESDGPTRVRCDSHGCPLENAGSPKRGGTLVVHVDAEPATLCDLVEHDLWSRWIVENQIGETLLEQDPWSGALTPRLAESLSGDASQLTLRLRPDVRWHDGARLTSADVVFTLERARDPAVGADQRADLAPLATVSAPDERTVVLRLARPAPFLRQTLAHITILPRHLLAGRDLRTLGRAPVGSGPFRFVSWSAGREIVVERNESYWGKPAQLSRIVFRVVRDREVALQLYRRGELDVLWRLVPSRVESVVSDGTLKGHRLYDWPMRSYGFIVYNTRRPPLGDVQVRRALGELVDTRRWIDLAFGGRARLITGPFVPGTASYDDAIVPPPFSRVPGPVLAKAGLRELSLLVPAGSQTGQALATLMQEDLAEAGVKLRVVPVEWASFLARLRAHDFEAATLQWTLSLEQDNEAFFHCAEATQGQNYGGFCDPRVDHLLDEIRATSDDTARHLRERQLHRLLAELQPYTFLAAPSVQTLVAPRVHRLPPTPTGFDFTRAWVE